MAYVDLILGYEKSEPDFGSGDSRPELPLN